MFIVKAFYNKKLYISPEDEIKLYHEVHELMKIWKIILSESNRRFTELSSDDKQILSNIIPHLDNYNFNDKKNIGPQLDKKIIEIILWAASNFIQQQSVVDEIYKKTRSSMFGYFYHDLLIDAYLNLNKPKEALDVIKYMFDKKHQAYFYAISNYDSRKFTNKEFIDGLDKYKNRIKIQLLANGEKVNLENISFSDLVELIQEVKETIASDLA